MDIIIPASASYEFKYQKVLLILFSLDEPGKPKGVELVDWDKDHADLKWQKPDSDGGAPITGYVIEYKVWIYFKKGK